MIVTRRRFFCGSAAIGLTGTVIAKTAIPPLLSAPSTPISSSAWTIGLLGKDGRELHAEGYERLALDLREGEGYTDLVPANGAARVYWTFPNVVFVAAWAAWMPGVSRPIRICTDHFPVTVGPYGTLTLNMNAEGYVLRLS